MSIYCLRWIWEVRVKRAVIIQLAHRLTKFPRGVVENVLIRICEFIYIVDFVVLETEQTANQIPVILWLTFLATFNALINLRNKMMRSSFDNITLELNIFNIQGQPLGFDDIETFILNWLEDYIFYDEFDDIFCYWIWVIFLLMMSFIDLFEFNDLCSTSECLIALLLRLIPPTYLQLKSLPESLKYSFFSLNEYLLVIIISDFRPRPRGKIDWLT